MTGPTIIAPGTFNEAAERHLPELLANLSEGSPWMELIHEIDDPARTNGPYYGPATQFMVDCFFDIADSTPALRENTRTPLERFSAAHYVIHEYIGRIAVGPDGVLSRAYSTTDISRTPNHERRFEHLKRDREHVLLGASVPFDDVSRAAGGAALMLDERGVNPDDITDKFVLSTGLHVIGRVHGTKTPLLTEVLGANYFEPRFFRPTESGLIEFTKPALKTIHSILSPHGCSSGRIHEGQSSMFKRYWEKISRYLLDDVDYDLMLIELERQRSNNGASVEISPLGAIGVRPAAPKTKKKPPRASKRYTPPKSK